MVAAAGGQERVHHRAVQRQDPRRQLDGLEDERPLTAVLRDEADDVLAEKDVEVRLCAGHGQDCPRLKLNSASCGTRTHEHTRVRTRAHIRAHIQPAKKSMEKIQQAGTIQQKRAGNTDLLFLQKANQFSLR